MPLYFYSFLHIHVPCLWVPVTTAWRVLRLRMEKRPPIWRVAANILNKQSRTADKGWSSSLVVGRGAKQLLTVKTYQVMNCLQEPRTWTDTVVRQVEITEFKISALKPTNTLYLGVTPNCLCFASYTFQPLPRSKSIVIGMLR